MPLRQGYHADMGNRIDFPTTRQRAERERRRIDGALHRPESGDDGRCLRCEEPIAAGRLRADPAATLGIDCAEASGGRK